MFVTGVKFIDDRTAFEPACSEFHSMIDIVTGACAVD